MLNWINFEVLDAGTTNERVFLTDAGFPCAGIWMWHTVTNASGDLIADPADHVGTQVLATGGDVPLRCDGIAIDANTNLYVIQNRGNPGDTTMRAAKFSNWDGQSVVSSGATWVVGKSDDSFRNLYGLALDSVSNPKFLACPMSAAGTVGANGAVGGGIRLLDAANGLSVYTESNTVHSLLPYYEPVADQFANGGNTYAIGDGLAGQTNRFGEGWGSVNSGSAAAQPVIVADNLSYSGLPSSTGNSVSVVPATSRRSARIGLVSATPTTAMYYSFILKITDVSLVLSNAANNFIAGFSDSQGAQAGTLARSTAKLVTKQAGSGYLLGIGKGTATGDYQYDTTIRNLNDVVFVVASYERVGGVTNVTLWVNPDSSSFGTASPPTPTAQMTSGSPAGDVNQNGVRAFVLSCQTATAPSATIDDIRVGKSWSFVTGGQEIGGPSPYVSNLTATVFYRSAGWDNVGNLYAGSQSLARWRVFSPPGTNEATTVALASIQIGTATPIHISNIGVAGGTVTINFTGSASDSTGSFTLQSSFFVEGTYGDAVGAVISQLSPGVFQATVATSGSTAFYRVKR